MNPTSEAVVVDASTAVKWVLAEEFSDRADALLMASLRTRRPILAPPHFVSEVTNAIFQRVRTTDPNKHIPAEQAHAALTQFLAFPVLLQSPPALYERAFLIAQHRQLRSTYDSLYVALAELAGAELWTSDRRLLNAVSTPWVRWIGDYPLP